MSPPYVLEVWLVSSDSNELPRERVPGTARKLEWVSGVLDLGEETLCGEVGRLSRSFDSRRGFSNEALEWMDPEDRRSVGETLPLWSRALVSVASTVSVESWSEACGGPGRIWIGGGRYPGCSRRTCQW